MLNLLIIYTYDLLWTILLGGSPYFSSFLSALFWSERKVDHHPFWFTVHLERLSFSPVFLFILFAVQRLWYLLVLDSQPYYFGHFCSQVDALMNTLPWCYWMLYLPFIWKIICLGRLYWFSHGTICIPNPTCYLCGGSSHRYGCMPVLCILWDFLK